jgi:hypothetical protein
MNRSHFSLLIALCLDAIYRTALFTVAVVYKLKLDNKYKTLTGYYFFILGSTLTGYEPNLMLYIIYFWAQIHWKYFAESNNSNY